MVIGILIALQINNWNEDKKSRKEQQKILIELKDEFKSNQDALRIIKEQHKFVMLKAEELSQMMSPNPKVVETEKLDSIMYAMVFLPEFNAVNRLTMSDRITLLDDALKNDIAFWKSKYDEYKYSIKITYNLYMDYIYPFVSENYQLKNIKSSMFETDKSYFENETMTILSNPAFENHVKMRSLNAQLLFNRANDLYNAQNTILESIDKLKKIEVTYTRTNR
ncbi:MAG TPA: hypothetical protein EYN07_00750 [Flavobacteriaceae bacterium]|nr:hypothetical protein [Flavobacteriaceae bacterium]